MGHYRVICSGNIPLNGHSKITNMLIREPKVLDIPYVILYNRIEVIPC